MPITFPLMMKPSPLDDETVTAALRLLRIYAVLQQQGQRYEFIPRAFRRILEEKGNVTRQIKLVAKKVQDADERGFFLLLLKSASIRANPRPIHITRTNTMPFRYRGPLAPTSPLFRGRTPELNRLTRLCRGEVEAYVIIYGGRQTGKTTLLTRFAHQLATTTALKVCSLDFQILPHASKERVYSYMGEQIAFALTGEEASPTLPDELALTRYVNRLLKESPAARLVLILEELGTLEPALREDLANMLRGMFTSRFTPANASMQKFMVIAAGGEEMYDLATRKNSPFDNICERIYLPDLSRDEAINLVSEGLHDDGLLPLNEAEQIGRAMYAQTHGHPYFTQYLGDLVATEIESGQWRSPAQFFDTALAHLLTHNTLLEHLHRTLIKEQLFSSLEDLLGGQVKFDRFDEEMARLELMGLARNEGGYWQVRNRLLGQAMTQWHVATVDLHAHLSQFSREQLYIFCYDSPAFAPLYRTFTTPLDHAPLVQTILTFSQHHHLNINLWQSTYKIQAKIGNL